MILVHFRQLPSACVPEIHGLAENWGSAMAVIVPRSFRLLDEFGAPKPGAVEWY